MITAADFSRFRHTHPDTISCADAGQPGHPLYEFSCISCNKPTEDPESEMCDACTTDTLEP